MEGNESSEHTSIDAGGSPAAGRYRDRLLSQLPERELAPLAPRLEHVTLEKRQLLYDAAAPIAHVHFPEHGIVSLLSVLEDGSAVETATIGHEGMIGVAVFHGVATTDEHAMIQVPGDGSRIEAEAFRALLPQLPALGALLHRFSVYLFTFAAQNSACNRKHSVEQRCARWLLNVRQRLETDELPLTHDSSRRCSASAARR